MSVKETAGQGLTTCQLRLKAAEIIERQGWHRGFYFSKRGAVCLIGALNVAATGDPLPRGGEVQIVTEALAQMGFRVCDRAQPNPIPDYASDWNDRKNRTKEDVLARLRAGCVPASLDASKGATE